MPVREKAKCKAIHTTHTHTFVLGRAMEFMLGSVCSCPRKLGGDCSEHSDLALRGGHGSRGPGAGDTSVESSVYTF